MAQVGQVKLWDRATGKERATFKLGKRGGQVLSVAFSPDGKFLAASGDLGLTPDPLDDDKRFGVVTLWDVTTEKERVSFKEEPDSLGGNSFAFLPVRSVVFSPDGKTLATVTTDNVKLRDWANQKELFSLNEAEKPEITDGAAIPTFLRVAFSPDGKTLASVHTHTGVKLWDVKNGKERLTIPKREGEGWLPMDSLAFSPDGKNLVTANNLNEVKDKFYVSSGEVNLWDTSTGKLRQRLPMETFVSSVAFSRDGKMLAAGCRGKVKFSAEPISQEDLAAGKRPKSVGDKKGTVKTWELKP